MTVTISQLSNTQTFGTWLARTNQIATVISANAVTTDNTVIGGFTSGNGTVIGHFGSNTLFAMDEFRGGNVAVSNTLSIISNTVFKYGTDELLWVTSNSTNSNVVISVKTVDISANDIGISGNYFSVNTSLEINLKSANFTANANLTRVNSNTVITGANLIINTTNTTFNSNTLITNRLNVSNAVVFSNTLSVTNSTSLSNTLNVVGAANLQSTANIGGTLGVTGATTLASTLSVTGAANVFSTFGIGGAANALSTFGISGAANALSTFGIGGAANALSTFGVTGATTLLSTFNVVGAANLQSSANVGGTLGVLGNATFSNSLVIVGNTTLSNTINIAGAANLQSSVGIGGNANVAGTLKVGGDLTVQGTLTFNGSAVASIVPTANLTYDIGSPALYWNNSYIGRGTFNDGISISSGASNSSFNSNLLFVDSLNSRVGISNSAPGSKLTVTGLVESTTGGFKFPDGTIQTSATAAGGLNTQVQYNSSGTLAGSAGFVFTSSSNNLSVANTLSVGATSINSVAYSTSLTFSFSGTSEVTVDSFPIATYRSAEYLIQFSDSTNSRYQVSKILVVHDGTTASFTEYGAISSSGIMGTFRATINAGNVTFLCTPLTSTTSIKIFRTNLTV
jgi:hypothetical protein